MLCGTHLTDGDSALAPMLCCRLRPDRLARRRTTNVFIVKMNDWLGL
jgi:hypothetical protein